MIADVVSQLHKINSSIIHKIIEDKTDLSGWFISEERPKWLNIGDNIYIWLNNDTFSKIKFINNLISLYDIEPSELVVEINMRK